MKHVFTLFILISTMELFGQSDSSKQTEQYFEFIAVKKGLFDKGYGFNISVNFGAKYLSTDSLTQTATIEKIQSFSKIEDVLEFMNGIGWKLVTAYTTSHDHFYTYFYIMKKEI
jgi:hypothetical protein